MQTEYVVRVSVAKMPASCRGRYNRVGVLEVEKGTEPKMISARARGVVRIVKTWEACNVGATERCAYRRALRAANLMAKTLNESK